MSDTRRVKSGLKRGSNVMSIAVTEAFDFLNAGIRKHYRGSGDTPSAARERAAKDAGISPAQAERLWKRWRTMASVDGDVYRALRNKYESLCLRVENAAEAMRRGKSRKPMRLIRALRRLAQAWHALCKTRKQRK